jgi:hypothetical protein
MKIFSLDIMPTYWIVCDNNGAYWRVAGNASGWKTRRRFYGDRSQLQPVTHLPPKIVEYLYGIPA